MAKSFIERFYELVADNLGDPATTRRLTKAKMFRDLMVVEKLIFERLLTACGQESLVGYTESTISITADEDRYLLPGGFRHFVGMEERSTDNPDLVLGRMPTIPPYHPGPGIIILSEQQGFIFKPTPTVTADWTLMYLKGPVGLHAGTAARVGSSSLTAGAVNADSGELVRLDDWYNGCLIHVYEADSGARQTRECDDFDGASGTFHVKHPWSALPTGNVKYEIRPHTPPDFDEIYAIDVAIKNATRRHNQRWRDLLAGQRAELWNGCLNYFTSNTMDRGSGRHMTPDEAAQPDPYELTY